MKIEVLDRRNQDREIPLSRLHTGEFFFHDGSPYPHQVLATNTESVIVLIWDGDRGSARICSLHMELKVIPINSVKLVIK
jgi:hypothetical protein